MSVDQNASATPAELAPSRWGAFAHAAFTAIWIGSIIANVGTAMYDAGSRWLMTSLDADPIAVSLVQVAVSLPIFLFTLPAGALADIVNPRRLLIVVEIANTIMTVMLATLVSSGLATVSSLLLTTFFLGVGGALAAPAWMAITPLLVSRRELEGAIAANSVGFNITRAVGPAIGGFVIAGFGMAAPFWICAASNLAAIAALLWWRAPQKSAQSLPAERLVSAMRTGLRHAANNRHLRATLIRTLAFFPFASAYWALLPLVARNQMTQGPELYGILLGAIGAGAIGGSFVLGWLRARLGADRLVAFGTLATAFALVLFGLAHNPATVLCACLIAGASWTLVLTSLYVSAQVALPDWVRGRGLAILLTTIFGAMTAGSAAWGEIAGMAGLPIAHFAAAAGAVLAIVLTWRWKLQTAIGIDLTPAMHWHKPVANHRVENNEGPVLVTVEYRIDPRDRDVFIEALEELAHERKRDGGFAWRLFEDAVDTRRFVETFLIESWLELMHQHERVTHADRLFEDQIRQLLDNDPHVTHWVACEPQPRFHGARKNKLVAALSDASSA
ncbi:MFS transporter [Methylocapsa sp. S129]|uniref:MFS transporter n=1 Tax=Methylocapsa sp. S129 TaxID=1641869 RepID=UPI00131BD183|nr:MFS transporter [Methylocapsa sp. S129]